MASPRTFVRMISLTNNLQLSFKIPANNNNTTILKSVLDAVDNMWEEKQDAKILL